MKESSLQVYGREFSYNESLIIDSQRGSLLFFRRDEKRWFLHIFVVFAICSIRYRKNRTFQHFERIWLRKRIFTIFKVLQVVFLFQNALWLIFYTIAITVIEYSWRIRQFCCEKAKILRSEIHKNSTMEPLLIYSQSSAWHAFPKSYRSFAYWRELNGFSQRSINC